MPGSSPYRGVMIVLARPAEGADEEEFRTWYENEHARDIVNHVEGVVSVRIHRLAATQPPAAGVAPEPFLAVYELDRPPAEVLVSFAEVGGRISMSDLLAADETTPRTHFYDLVSKSE